MASSDIVLSFIIPVYNKEKYLADCLDSILKQAVDKDKYEIIAVNDGSIDNSLKILEEYHNNYNNIVVVTEKNSGVSHARNKGMDIARGKYCWFVDADDMILKDCLRVIIPLVETDAFDRIRIGGYYFWKSLTEAEEKAIEGNLLKKNLGGDVVFAVCNIFNLEWLRERDIRFNEQLSFSEDAMFMLQVKLHKLNEVVIDKPFYLYRSNPSSTTVTEYKNYNSHRMKSFLKASQIAYKYYLENNETEIKRLCANAAMGNLWFYLYDATLMDRQEMKKALKVVKRVGMYPTKRLPECTIRKSYQTSRTDFVGKTFDFLYTHINSRYGFYLMVLFQKFRRIKNKL